MITIRPYQKKDFRYVQDICVATSSFADEDTPLNRASLCARYCDYYLDNEPEFCFVAVSDDDVPVGYILCSADVDKYNEEMEEKYLPLVRKLNGEEYFVFSAARKIEQHYIKMGYTAHLHIDILPDFQGQGIGTELVAALEKKLTESFVEGLYLICAKKNTQACAFYQKCGFEDIDYITNAVVYGKKFFKED